MCASVCRRRKNEQQENQTAYRSHLELIWTAQFEYQGMQNETTDAFFRGSRRF